MMLKGLRKVKTLFSRGPHQKVPILLKESHAIILNSNIFFFDVFLILCSQMPEVLALNFLTLLSQCHLELLKLTLHTKIPKQ